MPAVPTAPAAAAPAALPFQRAAIDAVSLDAGGVLVVPDHGLLSHALTTAGVDHDRDRFLDAHYEAMAEIDRARSEPETFTDYIHAFVGAAGVPPGHTEPAVAALGAVLVPPAWHQPIPGAKAAAARLAAAGLRLAVTSNADGNVAEQLARYETLQVGPGAGIEVEHISDSGVIGVHKPDPAIFRATAEGLALPPERICHVGDAGTYDADGAAAAGMVAVHVDPLGLCPGDHTHVASLADFAARLLADG
jgi:putative hydrolase of the HAD superfamily